LEVYDAAGLAQAKDVCRRGRLLVFVGVSFEMFLLFMYYSIYPFRFEFGVFYFVYLCRRLYSFAGTILR
jgi:hypothetical protein